MILVGRIRRAHGREMKTKGILHFLTAITSTTVRNETDVQTFLSDVIPECH